MTAPASHGEFADASRHSEPAESADVERGFRGVGRTRASGTALNSCSAHPSPERTRSAKVLWDCKKLKTILRSSEEHHDLRDAVSHVVELHRIPAVSLTGFFEVERRGIITRSNDQLLSSAAVRSYLSQVAPVRFRPDLPFWDKVLAHLGSQVRPGDLQIVIGDDATPV